MTEQELKDFLYSKYESGELTDAINAINNKTDIDKLEDDSNNGGMSVIVPAKTDDPAKPTSPDVKKLMEFFINSLGSAKEEEIVQGNTSYKISNKNTQLAQDIKWLIDMSTSGATLTPPERRVNRIYRKQRVDYDV